MPRHTARPRVFTFSVEGSGPFPIDMLRFDLCFPKSETDSGQITRSYMPRERGTRCVILVSSKQPTQGRWESFGWKVTTESINDA